MQLPELIHVSELSKVTGKDRATCRGRLGDLPYKIGNKGARMYDRKAAMALVMTNSPAEALEIGAKSRRDIAEAERAELRVAQIKGELVSADAMRQTAAELVKTLYQRIVRVEPGIIAAKCVKKNAIEIEVIVREQLTQVFSELKNMPENFLHVEDDDIVPVTDEDEETD